MELARRPPQDMHVRGVRSAAECSEADRRDPIANHQGSADLQPVLRIKTGLWSTTIQAVTTCGWFASCTLAGRRSRRTDTPR